MHPEPQGESITVVRPSSPLATGLTGAILPAMEGDASTPRPGLICPFEKMRPSQLNRDDAFYMALAFNLAVDAWRIDEVPIGAIITLDGEVIASAHNQRDSTRDPTAHAEMIALRAAAARSDSYRLLGTTLYVTLEPCAMCAGAMVNARLERVVYGATDPKAGAANSHFHLLDGAILNHRVDVVAGVLAAECGGILREFFQRKRRATGTS